MKFTTLTAYALPKTFSADVDTIGDALSHLPFTDCTPNAPMSAGFIGPIEAMETENLCLRLQSFYFVTLQIESKILPQTVVMQHAKKRIAELEKLGDRKLSAKERQEIKESTYLALLPRALTKLSKCHAYVDGEQHLLIVGTNHQATLDTFLDLWEKALPDATPIALATKDLTGLMTHWVADHIDLGEISYGEGYALTDKQDTRKTLRAQKTSPESALVYDCLKQGYQIKQMGLFWQDTLSFTLNEKAHLKQIRFIDKSVNDVSDIADDPIAREQADAFLYARTIQVMLKSLLPQVVA